VLPRVRRAAAFEALRDRADAHTTETGRRPAVFLATLGSLASSSARSGFATNLFQAGGLQTPSGGGSPAEVAEAFTAAGTKIACLCGTDQSYADGAGELATALREAGAAKVLLAGKPGTVSGTDAIDGYVYAGCDAIEVLTGALDELGVNS
jgi:methylmalonyl-CoA mutase